MEKYKVDNRHQHDRCVQDVEDVSDVESWTKSNKLKDHLQALLRRCEARFERERDDSDYSVYTGIAGACS